ncbi:MAG: hypothetical protein WDO13_00750 [Verrucomicrobiota bacterium]
MRDEWSASGDEERAYLHHLCAGFIPDYDLRYKLEQILFSNERPISVRASRKVPDDQKALFQTFVAGLVDDPATKPVAWRCARPGTIPARRPPTFIGCWMICGMRRDGLLKASRLEGLVDRAVALQHKISAPADPQLVALFHYMLQHHDPGVIGAILWHPDLFPPADAPSLWDDLEALKGAGTDRGKKSAAAARDVSRFSVRSPRPIYEPRGRLHQAMGRARQAAVGGAGGGFECTDRESLLVLLAGRRRADFCLGTGFSWRGSDDTLWLYGYDRSLLKDGVAMGVDAVLPAGLFQIHLPDLKTQVS